MYLLYSIHFDDLDAVKETYDLVSQNISHATPNIQQTTSSPAKLMLSIIYGR